MPADVAGLRRVTGVHFLDPTGSLLLQAGRELPPPLAEDRSVESGLLTDVAARSGDRATCGAGHLRDVEVFDADEVEVASEVRAGLLDPILAPVSLTSLEPGDLKPERDAAVRALLCASKATLQPQ
jgi:hypothetical protein